MLEISKIKHYIKNSLVLIILLIRSQINSHPIVLSIEYSRKIFWLFFVVFVINNNSMESLSSKCLNSKFFFQVFISMLIFKIHVIYKIFDALLLLVSSFLRLVSNCIWRVAIHVTNDVRTKINI